MPPAISIVVATHNRAALLERCVSALIQQDAPAGGFEIIVVDNASSDATPAVLERIAAHAPIRHLREEKLGKSHALNLGLGSARGAYVVFTDDDAAAPRTWLTQIHDAFARLEPRPAVVAGALRMVFDEPQPPPWLVDLVTPSLGNRARWLSDRNDLYGMCGANLSFRRDVLERVGGFATDRGPIGRRRPRAANDVEAVLRVAAQQPLVWYDPTIRVDHWTPKRDIQLTRLARRAYACGIAISELEGATLSPRHAVPRLARLARAGASAVHRYDGGWQAQIFRHGIRLAERLGRLRGARWTG